MSLLPQRILESIETKKGSLVMLGIIYLAGVLLTLLLVTSTAYGPIHFNDEVRYWNTVNQLVSGEFTVTDFHHSPPLYPISLLPAFLFFPAAKAYSVAKVLNVIYITSVIFPCYLLMRKFAGRGLSLLVAGMVLLLPAQMVMPRLIMSENLFYPLLLWAIYLAFAGIFPVNHKLRFLENILFGVLCGLMVVTRYLALPIVPALFMIWWLKPFDDEGPPLLITKKKVLHAASVFLPFLVVVSVWVVLGLRENVPLREMIGFGIASNPDPAQLGRRRLVMWAAFYLCYTVLMLAPYLGILATSVFQLNIRDWKNVINRWLVAVALISACFLVTATRHSWRARYNYPEPETIQGRYIFYLAPLFLIAVFAIIKKVDLPRLSRSAYWLAVIVLGELIALAYITIFQGAIFLNRPMRLSLNSPDGYIFLSLGIIFLVTAILLLVSTTYWMGRSKFALLTILPLALSGMYIIGNYRLYHDILKPLQQPNYQAYQLIRTLDAKYDIDSEVRSKQISLSVPYEFHNPTCGIWVATLRFNGFRDVRCVLGHKEGKKNPLLFEAQVGSNDLFRLLSLGPDAPEESRPTVFDFDGNYFEIEPAAAQP